jgi:hypothetical protein
VDGGLSTIGGAAVDVVTIILIVKRFLSFVSLHVSVFSCQGGRMKIGEMRIGSRTGVLKNNITIYTITCAFPYFTSVTVPRTNPVTRRRKYGTTVNCPLVWTARPRKPFPGRSCAPPLRRAVGRTPTAKRRSSKRPRVSTRRRTGLPGAATYRPRPPSVEPRIGRCDGADRGTLGMSPEALQFQ